MTAVFVALTVLALLIIVCTVAAFTWLFRTLKWEVVEDEEFQYSAAQSRAWGWSWLRAWLKPKPRQLTYRRDRRGRFRRHRR